MRTPTRRVPDHLLKRARKTQTVMSEAPKPPTRAMVLCGGCSANRRRHPEKCPKCGTYAVEHIPARVDETAGE